MEKEAKQPLLAVLFSLFIPGLGQVYSGKIWRGIAVFSFIIALAAGLIYWFIKPGMGISIIWYVLSSVLALSYLLAAADAYFLARQFNAANNLSGAGAVPAARAMLLGAVALALFVNLLSLSIIVIRYYFVRCVVTPADSMAPSLYPGEKVLVDIRVYKKCGPARGDIFVYLHPEQPGKVLMHRVVAFPGEKVLLKEHLIIINGSPIKESWSIRRRYYNRGEYGQKGKPIDVPPGCYYLLGDYSAGSADSRFFGGVPKEKLLGRVFKIAFPPHRSGRVE